MLFYQYTGFSAVPQAPEWLSRADNSHIVYVSFLDVSIFNAYDKELSRGTASACNMGRQRKEADQR